MMCVDFSDPTGHMGDQLVNCMHLVEDLTVQARLIDSVNAQNRCFCACMCGRWQQSAVDIVLFPARLQCCSTDCVTHTLT